MSQGYATAKIRWLTISHVLNLQRQWVVNNGQDTDHTGRQSSAPGGSLRWPSSVMKSFPGDARSTPLAAHHSPRRNKRNPSHPANTGYLPG